MAPKGHRAGSTTTQLRTHSRSSSSTRVAGNLQLTQKEGSSTKGAEKPKKNPHPHEVGRPGFSRAGSTQRVPSSTQIKRTGSAVNTTQQKENGTNNHAGFTLNQAPADGEEDDEDEWLSSSGAQTPNQDDSDSDTASEGERIPQDLLNQLQRTQLSKHQHQQTAHAPAPLTRVETARQSDFNTALAAGAGVPIETPSMQTPFPTTNSDPGVSADRKSQYVERHQAPSQPPPDRESNHTRSDSRQTHHSKRHSITRPPSTHSVSSRPDGMRPHPLIRGLSQGHFNTPHKPTPLAPLAVIADQAASGGTDGNLATSPASIKTSITSPGGYVEFPHERRSSVSSARSISILPSQSAILPPKSHDRIRTMSSMSASSTALSSLTHLPSVTRPPSPQQISFFPPVNPHVNIEAIHPLLPAPYLNNHLTVLARRTPLRESYNRVIQAKIASGR